MRKLTLGIMVLFVTMLAACGGNEEAGEVYQKAVEAGKKIESAEIDMVMKQTIEGDPALGAMVMNMDIEAAVTLDPLAMHQTGNMMMEIEGMPIDTEIEMYMTESELYMFESMSQTWMKMDSSMMPAELAGLDQGPADQLDMLEPFMDQVEFTEEDDLYVFKFAGEGEEIEEFTQQIMEENLGEDMFAEFGEDINQVMEDTTIHSIDFELHIDKETYDTKSVIMDLDLEIAADAEGNTMRLQQEMTAEYTGINTVEKIEVPQEVIDTAEEL